MKTRAVASVALAAALTLGLSACNFFSPQNTLQDYDPSDGIGANVGDLNVRNALLVTEDGERATLVMSVINTTGSNSSLEVEYESTAATAVGGRASFDIAVPAQSVISTSTAGESDSTQIVLEDIDAPAGSLFTVFLQTGSSEGVELQLPVLDDTLAEYDGLLPSPSPTPTPTPTPVVVPEPIPTPTIGSEPEPPAGGVDEGTEESTDSEG